MKYLVTRVYEVTKTLEVEIDISNYDNYAKVTALAGKESPEFWDIVSTKLIRTEVVSEDQKEMNCYDCGSTFSGHHTPSCEMAGYKSVKDLPEQPGTQWWDLNAVQPSAEAAIAANQKRIERQKVASKR